MFFSGDSICKGRDFITDKNIILADFAGFCYGVKRAVCTIKKIKEENPDKNVYVLGELIHNSHVIKELTDSGIKTVDYVPDDKNGIMVIRSHGAPSSVISEIKNKGMEIVDLTCLDVKKVQDKAVEIAKSGYFLIILGKKEHPEVVAIEANSRAVSDKVFVASNIDSLKEIEETLKKQEKIGVVIQTTQKIEYLKEVTNYLLSISKDLKIANTICKSTKLRQDEAKKLAKKSDLMLVIGSKKSANTTHLFEILSNITKTIHIEDDNELDLYLDDIEKAKNIGITAGASTPNDIIQKIIDKINN